MGFIYEERPSESPFVEAIWRTEDLSNGMYLAAADGAWDMIFVRQSGLTKVLLSGPSSHAQPVPYQAGNRNVGIRFRPGTFLSNIPVGTMLNTTDVLPAASPRTFWLDQQIWQLPTYENMDVFIAKLTRNDFIDMDDVVTSTLQGKRPEVTIRSIQRRFLRATGLSPRFHQQITRANHAVELLQAGISIRDVVYELEYADQAHMTRWVKHISGCTPGQIIRKMERARRFHSIQGYGVCAQMKVLNFNGGLYEDQTVQNQYCPNAARRFETSTCPDTLARPPQR